MRMENLVVPKPKIKLNKIKEDTSESNSVVLALISSKQKIRRYISSSTSLRLDQFNHTANFNYHKKGEDIVTDLMNISGHYKAIVEKYKSEITNMINNTSTHQVTSFRNNLISSLDPNVAGIIFALYFDGTRNVEHKTIHLTAICYSASTINEWWWWRGTRCEKVIGVIEEEFYLALTKTLDDFNEKLKKD